MDVNVAVGRGVCNASDATMSEREESEDDQEDPNLGWDRGSLSEQCGGWDVCSIGNNSFCHASTIRFLD